MPLAFDAVTFQNEELKDFLQTFEALAAGRAEATRRTANFHAVLFNIAAIFPEDKKAIFGLYSVPAVERSTGTKAAPVRQNKSVFGKVQKDDKDCPTCPDAVNTAAAPATPGINAPKKKADAAEQTPDIESRGFSSLPDELIAPPVTPPKKLETLNDVETLDELKTFLRVTERDPHEVVQELKSLLSAYQIEWPGTMKKLDSFLTLFFNEVIVKGGKTE